MQCKPGGRSRALLFAHNYSSGPGRHKGFAVFARKIDCGNLAQGARNMTNKSTDVVDLEFFIACTVVGLTGILFLARYLSSIA
jgi:hypothetical protein